MLGRIRIFTHRDLRKFVNPLGMYLSVFDACDIMWQLFHKMFPEEEFFPETTFSQLDDDGELAPSPNYDSLDS